jgi:hypothetical protein
MKKITLIDVLICMIFIVSIIIISFFVFFVNSKKSSILIIQTKNDKYYYSINQNKTLKINGELGVTTIEIKNDRFHFIDSPCKNKICIHFGWSDSPNVPIICLPNKVSAYIINNDKDNKYDGISQ